MEIPLTNGGVAIIDDTDYELVRFKKWHKCKPPNSSTFYAYMRPTTAGVRKRVAMHRLLMGDSANGLKVDHANFNGLDNRRSNLRVVTNSQSNAYRKVSRNNHCGLKGVRLGGAGRWRASIRIDGKLMHLGMFSSPFRAAIAYDEAAVKHWGEFACTNAQTSEWLRRIHQQAFQG